MQKGRQSPEGQGLDSRVTDALNCFGIFAPSLKRGEQLRPTLREGDKY